MKQRILTTLAAGLLLCGCTTTSTNTYLIAPQYLVDFREMNRWRKAKPTQ